MPWNDAQQSILTNERKNAYHEGESEYEEGEVAHHRYLSVPLGLTAVDIPEWHQNDIFAQHDGMVNRIFFSVVTFFRCYAKHVCKRSNQGYEFEDKSAVEWFEICQQNIHEQHMDNTNYTNIESEFRGEQHQSHHSRDYCKELPNWVKGNPLIKDNIISDKSNERVKHARYFMWFSSRIRSVCSDETNDHEREPNEVNTERNTADAMVLLTTLKKWTYLSRRRGSHSRFVWQECKFEEPVEAQIP